MPYIAEDARRELTYGDRDPETPGELNWAITLEVVAYLDRKGLSYQSINDIVGALEGAKLEFYRRVAVPFEAEKQIVNGDVY
jgi:hypothetical protein